MLLKDLREQVLKANLELVEAGLVLYTFGNASGIDRNEGLVAIKPSGVSYESMRPSDFVLTDLDGIIVEGDLKPSSDLDTHLVLYKYFPADRRSSPHPLHLRHVVGAGRQTHSRLRHHARRLFPRARPGN